MNAVPRTREAADSEDFSELYAAWSGAHSCRVAVRRGAWGSKPVTHNTKQDQKLRAVR